MTSGISRSATTTAFSGWRATSTRTPQVPRRLALGRRHRGHVSLREPAHGDPRRARRHLRQPRHRRDRGGRRPRPQAAGAGAGGRHGHDRRGHRAFPARVAARERPRRLHARGRDRGRGPAQAAARLSALGHGPGARGRRLHVRGSDGERGEGARDARRARPARIHRARRARAGDHRHVVRQARRALDDDADRRAGAHPDRGQDRGAGVERLRSRGHRRAPHRRNGLESARRFRQAGHRAHRLLGPEGMASSLPEPLAKASAEARPATFAIARLGTENEVTTVAIGGGVQGWFSRNRRRGRGTLERRAQVRRPIASEPVRGGLWLHGELPALDVDACRRSSPCRATQRSRPSRPSGASSCAAWTSSSAARAYWGRDFQQMQARLERTGTQWKASWKAAGGGRRALELEGKGRLAAKLERLAIIDPAAGSVAAEREPGTQADLPARRHRRALRIPRQVAGQARPEGRAHGRRVAHRQARHRQQPRAVPLDRAPGGAPPRAPSPRSRSSSTATISTPSWAVRLRRIHAARARRLEGTLVWPAIPTTFRFRTSPAPSSRGTARAVRQDRARRGQAAGAAVAQSLPRARVVRFPRRVQRGLRLREDLRRGQGRARHPAHRGLRDQRAVRLREPLGRSVAAAGNPGAQHAHRPEVGEGLALAATLIGTPCWACPRCSSPSCCAIRSARRLPTSTRSPGRGTIPRSRASPRHRRRPRPRRTPRPR